MRALAACYADVSRSLYYRQWSGQTAIEGDGIIEDGSRVAKKDVLNVHLDSGGLYSAGAHQRLSNQVAAHDPGPAIERAGRVIRTRKKERKPQGRHAKMFMYAVIQAACIAYPTSNMAPWIASRIPIPPPGAVRCYSAQGATTSGGTSKAGSHLGFCQMNFGTLRVIVACGSSAT